jgi:hypothetical protein
MGQGFSKHVVLVFDGDLEYQGAGLIAKAELKGLAADASHVKHVYQFTNELAGNKAYMTEQKTALNGVGIDAETKVTLLSHGYDDPDESAGAGKKLFIGRNKIFPSSMAFLLRIMLGGTKIKRVSIFACYAGGNRGKRFGGPNGPTIKRTPDNSFGFEFAAIAGKISKDVTARTQPVNTVIQIQNSTNPQAAVYKYVYQTVGAIPTTHQVTQHKTVNGKIVGTEKKKNDLPGRYHSAEDKVVFTPNAESDVKSPIPPTWKYETYA